MNFHASDFNPYTSNPSNLNPYASNQYSTYATPAYPQFLEPSQPRHYRTPSEPDSYIQRSEVVILEPQAFAEIPSAVQILRRNQLVVLNLARMSNEEAQRSIDFIAGGAYMCQGSLEKIDVNIFLLTPQDTNIRVEENQSQARSDSPQEPSSLGTNPDVAISSPNYFLTPRAS